MAVSSFDSEFTTLASLSYSMVFVFLILFLLIHFCGHIGKDDLRLKLMRKSALGQADSNGSKRHMDLREKLSKASHPLANTYNSKQHGPDSRETSLRQIPSARSSDKLLRMESMRSSYSPWTLDHIRRRSPDGFPSTSRGISPQRDVQDLHRRPVSRTYDGVRSVSYVGRDVLETSRPPISTPQSFMSRSTMSTLPPVTVKPVASHPGQLPPSGSVAQRPSYVVSITYLLASRYPFSQPFLLVYLEKIFLRPSVGYPS